MNGGIKMKKRTLFLIVCVLMLTTLFAGFGAKAAPVVEKEVILNIFMITKLVLKLQGK